MEKKYQVFVSSTYKDLQRERQEVMQALLELDCIPVGMELFPAADDDQWTLIKGLISDCDYYVLIVAGRYGSIDKKTERSYTQMEYEFAIEQGIPVISFVHKDPGNISSINTEPTDEGKAKLKNFIELVENKMCQFWNSPEDLGSKVSRSLVKLIKAKPRIGWIKANEISSAEANKDLLKVRKDNEELVRQIRVLSSKIPEGTEVFAQGEETFLIHYCQIFPHADSDQEEVYSKEVSWNKIFLSVCTTLLKPVMEDHIRVCLERKMLSEYDCIIDDDFQTILIQLMALKLIETNIVQGVYTYWVLTPYGRSAMVNLKAQRR